MSLFRTLFTLCLAALGLLALPGQAAAANCNVATSQGSTGPANWQTYCWLDFAGYNDTIARSGAGQNFSYTLSDGTTLTFNLKVTTPAALSSVAAPSWSGAAVGNTAFLGIAGRPILYQTGAGTTTVTRNSERIILLRWQPGQGRHGRASCCAGACRGWRRR